MWRKGHKIMSWLGGAVLLAALQAPGAGAAPVLEVTDYVTGIEGLSFSFDVGDVPGTFEAALGDLSFGPLEFAYLGLSISTAATTLGTLDAPGRFFFEGVPGITYYANVFAVGSGDFNTGLFGAQVSAVPLPAPLVMLLSGIVLLVLVRRRPPG